MVDYHPIRSIFEDYLAPARDNPTCTSFESVPHLRITLVWGLIRFHLAEYNIISKTIKDHTIAVGAYDQWLVINSGRKEDLQDNTFTVKLKDHVEKLSAMCSSTTKSISEIKTTVATANKVEDQAARKISSTKK